MAKADKKPEQKKMDLLEDTDLAEYCSALVSVYPKGNRLTPYLECMSREAKKRNIEI